ncbi:MAG TPA: hypothetical protein VH720_01230 [Candidatus Limnocylindrales bacterium]
MTAGPWIRRVLALDQPQETRFFLGLGVFGLAIGVVYGAWTREVAGTVLLVGFGVATGAIGVALARSSVAAAVRAAARSSPDAPTMDRRDIAGGGTGGIDRPFLDEAGRLPSPTFAPFAIGLGVSLALVSIVFGLAMLVVAAPPLVWGAWTWLRRARSELDAQAGAPSATRGESS